MATNIQSNSHTELRAYLEEHLHAQFPSANSQDILNAVEIATGRRGYVLHQEQQHDHQQNRDQQRSQQQDNLQRDNARRDNQQASQGLVAVREAAISAAQAIPEHPVRIAAVASAWVAFAAANVAHEQNQNQNQNANQQRPGRN